MNENKGLVIHIGGASIMLILLAFVLSTFAVLSIKASNNEFRLAKKTAASVQEYYEADAKAQKVLAYLDALMKSVAEEELAESLASAAQSCGVEGISNMQIKNKTAIENVQEEEIDVIEDDFLPQTMVISYEVTIREKTKLYVELEWNEKKEPKIVLWKVKSEELEGYDMDLEENLWDGKIELD